MAPSDLNLSNAHWAELGRIGSKILNSEAIFTKTLMAFMSRVDMVGTNHNKVLTQYFFDTNYFHLLLGLRSFSKIGAVKVDYFDFSGEIFETLL